MYTLLESDTDRYTKVYSQNENPGIYLVKVNDTTNLDSPIEPGTSGVLFTGHSDIDNNALNGSGIFFSVDRITDIVQNGTQGDVFCTISGLKRFDQECIWCNESISASENVIEFQEEIINPIFSEHAPLFHTKCFLKFRTSLQEILKQPEIVSHTV